MYLVIRLQVAVQGGPKIQLSLNVCNGVQRCFFHVGFLLLCWKSSFTVAESEPYSFNTMHTDSLLSCTVSDDLYVHACPSGAVY